MNSKIFLFIALVLLPLFVNAQSGSIRVECRSYRQETKKQLVFDRKGQTNIFLVNVYKNGDVIHYTQADRKATYKMVKYMGRTKNGKTENDSWLMNYDGTDIFFGLTFIGDDLLCVTIYFIESESMLIYYDVVGDE